MQRRSVLRAWRAMESHVERGHVRHLGISNQYDARDLSRLLADAHVKPLCVQNRFVAQHGRHDVEVRALCSQHGVRYSSFWTLSGNKQLLQGRAVRDVARAHGCTPEQAWLGFVRGLGISPLSGTTSEAHMRHDLALPALSEQEVERLGYLIG